MQYFWTQRRRHRGQPSKFSKTRRAADQQEWDFTGPGLRGNRFYHVFTGLQLITHYLGQIVSDDMLPPISFTSQSEHFNVVIIVCSAPLQILYLV